MKLNCAVVEDELLACRSLIDILSRNDYVTKAKGYTTGNAFESAMEQEHFDLVLMDINLGDADGLELGATFLNKSDSPCYLAFVTAYDEHAIPALKLGAFDYVLKPYSPTEIEELIRKVVDKVQKPLTAAHPARPVTLPQNSKPQYKVQERKCSYIINKQDILAAEAYGNYLEIVTPAKHYLARTTFKAFLDANQDYGLVRIHRSTAVNIHYIVKMFSDDDSQVFVQLSNHRQYKVTESYRASLSAALDKITDG